MTSATHAPATVPALAPAGARIAAPAAVRDVAPIASTATAPATAPATALAAVLTAVLASAAATILAAALAAGAAHAGKLYRWAEPDGALTYSPTPPSDGTPYVEVDPMTMKPALEAERTAPSVVRAAPRTPGTTAPAVATEAAVVAAPAPRRAAAPTLGAAERQAASRIVVRDATPAAATAQAARTTRAEPAGNGDTRHIIASSDKGARCEELRKRVISLERRLATPLTPEDMDNTVVHMARYQQSFERNCRR